MTKFKIIISMFLLFIGLTAAFLTYDLKTNYFYLHNYPPEAYTSLGKESANNGVAVGLGIISAFSFLSSALLLNSIQKIKEK